MRDRNATSYLGRNCYFSRMEYCLYIAGCFSSEKRCYLHHVRYPSPTFPQDSWGLGKHHSHLIGSFSSGPQHFVFLWAFLWLFWVWAAVTLRASSNGCRCCFGLQFTAGAIHQRHKRDSDIKKEAVWARPVWRENSRLSFLLLNIGEGSPGNPGQSLVNPGRYSSCQPVDLDCDPRLGEFFTVSPLTRIGQ